VDGSAFAAHASDAGLDLAHQLGAEIAFVTIVDPAMTQVAAVWNTVEWWLEQGGARGEAPF
jgi:nucleotide-binding universal stress UspA family protein